MKIKIYISIIFFCSILLGLGLWILRHPVEIIDVHQRVKYSDILVKNFPFTDKGKIKWWLENKDMLKEKYNIPNPTQDGLFSVTFWDFGEGYKEDKYDRRCFDDMKTNKNCIEKKIIFTVDNDKHKRIIFTMYDGDDYRMNENGDIIKMKRDD
ncbi:DUF943 family protein [Serratia sp. UGAL515B_01]|uniref:DUF943 family protein n=1 Tax=Serratia sp. UGAL515B_01 TaxID=2986763 RepID=UPI002954C29B|nr:DUF943 family protein [Serratia sp. UGAL515B_01]WON77654.1 DUF943 family protein [Serratia sp. UGAL515B_01]